MKTTVAKATDVLDLLMNPAVQKEIKRVQPQLNRTDLVLQILEAWPDGQKGFARAIVAEFLADRPGGTGRAATIRLVTELICKESETKTVRPVEDLSDDELAAAIKSVGPALGLIKENINVEEV